MNKKFITLMAILLGLLSLTGTADAATVIEQPDFSTQNNLSQSNPAQELGSGLSGTFESLEIKYHPFKTGICNYYLWIREYATAGEWRTQFHNTLNNYTSPGAKSCTQFVGDVKTDIWQAADFSETINFDPTRHYILLFYQLDGNGLTQGMLGSAIDNFPSGEFCHVAGNTTWQCNSSVADAYFVLTLEPSRDPVIVMPGFAGSWRDPDDLTQLLVDPIFHTYDNLFEALRQVGYADDFNLFGFPYDWRLDNNLSAFDLSQKIQEIKNNTGAKQVDIVAHSMGGLVARAYVQGSLYNNDVDQLIFLGSPHQGSPESYLAWEGGEFAPENLGSFFKKLFFSFKAGQSGCQSIFEYVQNEVPSARQLLPIYDYLKDKASGIVQSYPSNYPQNIFLENLNSISGLGNLFSLVNLSNIVSDIGDTINIIRVVPSPELPKWQHGIPDEFYSSIGDQGLEKGPGDLTVPLASADSLPVPPVFVSSAHSELPTQAQQDVIEALTGSRPAQFINDAAPFTGPLEKLLIFFIFSPANLQVIDPSGQKVGKDFTSSQNLAQIPGAYYAGPVAEEEFITIPNPSDGDYQILLDGTGEGNYEVQVSLIDDEQVVTSSFNGYIKEALKETLNFSFNSTTSEIIDLVPEDQTPPEIIINSPQNEVLTHQDSITIDFEVTDDTGVQSEQATLSSQPRVVTNGELVDLFGESAGTHTLTVTATDYLGNKATSTVQFTIGATYDSLIKDIKQAYENGWSTQLGIKNSLLDLAKSIKKTKSNFVRKIQLEIMLKLIESYYNKKFVFITDEGYNLLKGDVEYLLNNL